MQAAACKLNSHQGSLWRCWQGCIGGLLARQWKRCMHRFLRLPELGLHAHAAIAAAALAAPHACTGHAYMVTADVV